MSFICVTTIGSSSWGIYTIAITGELIITSLGMGVILGLFFILINKESQRIEKYLYEEEQKQQDL